jgi:hypothetical protein
LDFSAGDKQCANDRHSRLDAMVVSPNHQDLACTPAIARGGCEPRPRTARIPGDDQRPRASNRQSRSGGASCLLPRSPASHISHRPSLHPITYLHGCGGELGGVSIKVNDEQLGQTRFYGSFGSFSSRGTRHTLTGTRTGTYRQYAILRTIWSPHTIRLSNSFDLNAYVDGLRVSTRRFWRRAEVTQAVTPHATPSVALENHEPLIYPSHYRELSRPKSLWGKSLSPVESSP